MTTEGKLIPFCLSKVIKDIYDLSPVGMIKKFDLLRPMFKRTACYGHFGREEEGFTWELRDTADSIKTGAEA